MSDKKKYPFRDCLAVAEELVQHLKPMTERIIVAGSIRRQRPLCSDVEILHVPKFVNDIPEDMFEAAEPLSAAGLKLAELLAQGILAKRPNKNGVTSWGELNKLAVHVASGIPVDLFACAADRWWTSLVIRTGGIATNLELTTTAKKNGLCLHAYGNIEVLRDRRILEPQSERDVFAFCGVKYREPIDRP